MEDQYERTPEDVRHMIRHAKLHERELLPLTQVLSFPQDAALHGDLRLLQLDQHLLQELAGQGSLVFKGSQSDNAVLCTSDRTYDIKEAETSNSMLLVPHLMWSKECKDFPSDSSDTVKDALQNMDIDNDRKNLNTSDKTSPNTSLNYSADSDELFKSPRKIHDKKILKVFYTYLEPRLCKPHFGKLNDLLQFTKYSGPEVEFNIDKKLLLTLEQLKEIIQASDSELLHGLDDIQAMEIDGFYRILSFDYEFRVLSHMLDLIEENSWSLQRISKKTTVETLKDLVPEIVLDNLFDLYTVQTGFEGDEQFYMYKEEKVCCFLAQVLLKSAGRFNLDDFMQAWKDSVPEGMQAQESMLRGMALTDTEASPPVIWAFSESILPENVTERFRILFQTKQKWTVQQIAPYIERFATDKINVNALLTKYARGSTENNVRYYSAKHSK